MFKAKVIGETVQRIVTVRVCMGCGSSIGEEGLCDYQCGYDGDLVRPAGTVMVRTYERTDRLISERPEAAI